MSSTDHIESFSLSAVLHLLGILLLCYTYTVTRQMAEEKITAPEPAFSGVELTLINEDGRLPGPEGEPPGPEEKTPGAPQAGGGPTAAIPALQVPVPFEQAPQPQLPDKPDFADALPQPEPLPEPTPIPEPAPQPVPSPVPQPVPQPKPVPAPLPKSSPTPTAAVRAPAPTTAPAAGKAAAPGSAPASPMPSLVNVSAGEGGGSGGSGGGGGGGSGGGSGQFDGHPSLERPIRPSYPIGARRRGEEGTVILDATVTAEGHASNVTIVTSSGFPDLDRAAERAVLQARFKPGTRNGRPTTSAARLTLIFRLLDL